MKRSRTVALIVTAVFVICGVAMATPQWTKMFNDTYKPKAGTALAAGGCKICHTSPSGGARNKYGKLLDGKAVTAASLKAVGAKDADGDGFTNAQEIAAGKLPGDASSKPSSCR